MARLCPTALVAEMNRISARLDRHLNAASVLDIEMKRLEKQYAECEKLREVRRDVIVKRWELRSLVRHLRGALKEISLDSNRFQFSVLRWTPALSNDIRRVRRLVAGLKDRSERYSPISGIYMLINDGDIVYVGKALNVHERLSTHHRERQKPFERACVIPTPPHLLDQREQQLIRLLQPTHNRTFIGNTFFNYESRPQPVQLISSNRSPEFPANQEITT